MKTIIIALSILMTFAFAACGSSGGGGVADPGNPGTVNPPPVVNPYDISQCQVGQIFNPAYGCLNQNTCQSGYGWVPGEFKCVPGTIVGGNGGSTMPSTYYSSFSPNSTLFAQVLKFHRVCDPAWVGWNWGDANCANWAKAGFVMIQGATSTGGTATVLIGAGASDWRYSRYIPLQFTGTVQPYNNSNGFIIQSGTGISIVADYGSLSGNSTFDVRLEYQGQVFGTARLSRTY